MKCSNLTKEKEVIERTGVEEITLDLQNYSAADLEVIIDKETIRMISGLNAKVDISSIGIRFEKMSTL